MIGGKNTVGGARDDDMEKENCMKMALEKLKSFCIKMPHEKLKEIEKYLESNNIPYTLFVYTGVFPQEGAKYVIDYGTEEDTESYFATVDFLDVGKDGVFYALRTDGIHKECPSFKDIFDIKEY